MTCDCKNTPPDFALADAVGTDVCVATSPCDPNACCNYYSQINEGLGQSFVYSAGGPFQISVPFPPVGCEASHCTNDGLHVIQDPLAGALALPICVPNLPPGTYRALARFEIRNSQPGTSVVVLFRPDCSVGTDYLVASCGTPCPGCVGGSLPQNPPENIVCDAELYVETTGCNPGFVVLGASGCPLDPTSTGAPTIENLQIALVRISGRSIVDCGGSPLVEFVAPAQPDVLCVA